MIETGQAAPDFTLPDQDGEPVSLTTIGGRPSSSTSIPRPTRRAARRRRAGCATTITEFNDVGAAVLGVSPDPVKAVKKFHDGQGLNFTLLADEDHAVCDLYGVWGEKSMYGKTYWGAQRATFIIDGDGKSRT